MGQRYRYRCALAALSRTPGELKEAIVKELCEVSGQRLILLMSNQGQKGGEDADFFDVEKMG